MAIGSGGVDFNEFMQALKLQALSENNKGSTFAVDELTKRKVEYEARRNNIGKNINSSIQNNQDIENIDRTIKKIDEAIDRISKLNEVYQTQGKSLDYLLQQLLKEVEAKLQEVNQLKILHETTGEYNVELDRSRKELIQAKNKLFNIENLIFTKLRYVLDRESEKKIAQIRALNEYDVSHIPLGQRAKYFLGKLDTYKNTMGKATVLLNSVLNDPNATGTEKESARQQFARSKLEAEATRGDIGVSQILQAAGNDAMTGLLTGGAVPELADIGSMISSSLGPYGILIEIIIKLLQGINKAVGQGITESMNLQSLYLGTIDARLQGSGLDKDGSGVGIYTALQDYLGNFAASPYVNQKTLLLNISKLTESGIAWNVEERALVQTLTDKMVTTFDALDSSLTRMIRLLGADLTYAQAGLEASLNKFFNSTFSDTSYLSDAYDKVAETLLEATSQLNYEEAVAFLYAVQKWLGSLYSVGMSQSGVSTIAQGLTYLATGNVNALSSDSSLLTLLALSAKNAGLSYTDLLTYGLDADKTNMLMESMVNYLQLIVDNTGNNVIRSAWSNIATLNMSDIRAISNLTQSDLELITQLYGDYNTGTTEFTNLLGKVANRTSMADIVSNIKDNVLLTIGNSLVGDRNNPLDITTYLLWSAGEALPGVVGDALLTLTLAGNVLVDVAGYIKGWVTGSDYEALGLISGIQDVIADMKTWTDKESSFIKYIGILNNSESVINERGNQYLSNILNSVAPLISYSGSFNLPVLPMGMSGTGSYSTSSGSEYIGNASTLDYELNLTDNPLTTISASNAPAAGKYRDVGDLYAMLFEQRTVPIRVLLAEVEDEAAERLHADELNENLRALYGDEVMPGLQVQLEETNLNAIVAAVRNIY